MAEEVTSGEVRTRRFDIVRKGYDRTQVDEFLASVARRIDKLEESIGEADRAAIALGLDDAEALARELNTIGGEVGAILEAARAAAEGMRTRAAADAKELEATSKETSSTMLSEAMEQSHSMRAAAWNEGSSMLQSALAEAKALAEEAREKALFIRAEAEREAIRHVGDAKRDRDSTIGEARIEADQIIENARSESDGVLAAANQSAELAQERARALEERRSELLAELEAARASIGHLETEIESKRQELEVPEVPDVVPPPQDDGGTHHSPDGGSVKIVAGSKVIPLNPVDADSFVAEVEALHRRERESLPDESGIEPVETVMTIAPTPVGADRSVDEHPQPEPELHVVPTPEPEPTPEPAPEPAPEPELQPEPEPEPTPEPEPVPVPQPAPEPEPQPEPEPTPEPEPVPAPQPALEPKPEDDLGALFAQLRSGVESPAKSGASDAADSRQPTAESGASHEPRAADSRQPIAESGASHEPRAADSRRRIADSGASDKPPVPQPTADSGAPDEPPAAADSESPAADSRQPTADSVAPATPSLIPAQNAALRTIKRSLVDLQNDTLEQLRSQDGWLPDEAFTDRFSEPFTELASAVGASDDKGAASAFGTDLYDSVTSAIERARDAGSGERAVAAAASKVFRTWRSDEAERRVVAVATALSQDSSSK
ncbi:hypothetical protein MNBD_ACTINO01-2160 [hydrothermal vent metagenome]|uniref:Cell division initiation protein DivIVA n=1 Tax=hydrothermal vent metagenome TaxID=652676 RepID=A0A3B0SQI8_9ZZZZ